MLVPKVVLMWKVSRLEMEKKLLFKLSLRRAHCSMYSWLRRGSKIVPGIYMKRVWREIQLFAGMAEKCIAIPGLPTNNQRK